MGGLFGKKRNTADDPFYRPVPPPRSLPPLPPVPPPAGYDPSGGLAEYGTYEEYGYEYYPTPTIGNLYGGPNKRRPTNYGGLYAQGLNQMPCIAPWNYGNYYLGNTTMQMMPFMLNKVAQYGQMQAMAALGNAGLLGPAPMMPSMPYMPYSMPASFSMPMAAPMMAAATPLPVAFNPLVQGMYPMASMSPVNWMTPSSFMSALTSGPMPYRPPGFDFPSNIGMVMTIPYGTPNPLLSSPPFGGFSSSYNFGGGFPWCCCCCCYCMPPVTAPAPPTISYYPRPICVPQPYAVPYPAPVAIPNVQQVPVPRPVSVVAPPIVAGCNQILPSAGAPLWPSQGVFTNGSVVQPAVMASNNNSTAPTSINNQSTRGLLPVYNPTNQAPSLIGQPVTSSLSNPELNNNGRPSITPSTAKNENQPSQTRDTIYDRFRRHIPSIPRLSYSKYNLTRSYPRRDPVLPPILNGQLISDSGWLPKNSEPQTISSILSGKNRKRPLYTTENGKSISYSNGSRVSFIPHRRRHRSSSSASEYDCPICQQQREKRRLRQYYGSSTVSSLLSPPKESRKHHLSTNESILSSTPYTPTSFKQDSYKSYRRHPTRIKVKNKTSSPKKSSSPLLIRQSPIQEQRQHDTIHEVEHEEEIEVEVEEEEKKEEQVEKKLIDDNDSIIEKPDHHESKLSLISTDE